MFRETQKHEMKKMKDTEAVSLPREQRKEVLRRIKEEKEIEQTEKERKFLEQQQENTEHSMKRLADQHRDKIASIERQSLEQKHQLLRGM